MNGCNLLTQIKNDVQNKRIKKYQNIKQKNNAKYYQLYLNKIIYIQKFWRNHLTRKAIILEKLALKQLNKNIQYREINQNLKNQLNLLKKQNQDLQNCNPNNQQVFYIKTLQNQLKNSIKNVLQGADRYAKIKAVLKNQMKSFQQIVKENEKLKKSCQKTSFQTQSFKQKNKQLQEKIQALKNKISDQKAEIIFLKQKNKANFYFFPQE